MEVKPCRAVPVTLTSTQLETAIRLARKSGKSGTSLLKKLIAARSHADYPRSLERAVRLKNWQ